MVTSLAGVRPTGSSIAYAMTKAALNHLTLLLAKSCGPVRVNAVAPGLVETPWTADWQPVHEHVAKVTPLHRVGHARGLRRGGARLRPQPPPHRADPGRSTAAARW